MRPLRLAVQGFTCFRQHTEIDFEQLDLYAIQGPTGSGKSSLLDAIMYALYGQTPRLGRTGHDALITAGERALSVSLEFEAAGARYRVARSKGRRQADNEVRFERWAGDRFVGLTETRRAETQQVIEKAVGLNFDSFTRAVVLPQGQFDRFLRGTSRDRQELLGALLGLEHYRRMAEAAGEKRTAIAAELRAKQALLDGEYAQLSAELLAQWREELAQAEQGTLGWDQERTRLAALLTELRAVAGLHGQLAGARERLARIEAGRSQVELNAERARRARRVAGVLPRLEARDQARASAERAGRDTQTAQDALTRAEGAARQAQAALEQAEQAARELPELEARVEVLREAERQGALLKRYGGTPGLSVENPIAWDEDAFLAAREQVSQQQTWAAEAKAVETEAREIEARRLRLAHDEETLAAWRTQLADVTEKGKQVRAEHDAAQEELRAEREREGIAALRHHLHAGEPCPLCEQTVRQLPPRSESRVAVLEKRTQTLEETLAAMRDRLSDLRANVKATEGTVTRDRSDLYRREEALAQRRAALQAAQAGLDADAALTARRLLAGLAAELREISADPAAERQTVVADLGARRARLDQARREDATARASGAGTRAALDAAARTLQERASDLEAAEALADQALREQQLTEEEARAAALPEADISRYEEAHRSWGNAHAQAHAEAVELEQRLDGRPHDPAALDETQAAFVAAERALAAGRRRAGELGEQLRSGEERFARKAELQASTAALARDLDHWAQLVQALRVNEFPQYLLSEIETNLLERAGGLLHEISDGRYRLLLDGTEYSVQDQWNAGELRGVKTLSGGETFLASLSLAIALSDYLAGNHILGALFLDEGFGTLDPQALEAVAGALEKVRTQGRMVGVITHVESLSERLPARILVSKSLAGSRALRME